MEPSSSSSSPRVPSRSFLGLGLGLLVAIAALIINFFNEPTIQPRLWTAEELIIYNGTDEGLPILLGILGTVFDVTKGKSHYGPGGGYHHFAGRDASRAFVSGNFTGDGLTDSLHGLASTEVNSIVDWRKFYNERYKCVGKLVGRYYDDKGNPTKYLKGVEAKSKRGAQLLEKQKIEEEKIPSCNSRWSDHEGGKVWCDTGYPRLVKRPLESAISGKVSQRCACFKEEELDRPGLEIYGEIICYTGCIALEQRGERGVIFGYLSGNFARIRILSTHDPNPVAGPRVQHMPYFFFLLHQLFSIMVAAKREKKIGGMSCSQTVNRN